MPPVRIYTPVELRARYPTMPTSDESKASTELPVLPLVQGLDELMSDAPARPAVIGVIPEMLEAGSGGQEMAPVRVPEGRSTVPSSQEPVVVNGDDPYLGKQFGGYEMVTKIGQGGMGLVYKGRQVSLDRVVAVKILNKTLCDNPEFIKRFEREAKSIARINHPNILAVYDFGQTDGVWFMVTEFVEGSSLSRQITDRLVLPWEEISPLMMQCLAGLSYVGQGGIVHRDIKPDNILITPEGVPKIADFGLAKDVSGNDNTDLTTVGMAMGTPAYMSPEQCMGRKLDGRSDIYSLGVSAYLALTGEKPFVGQSSFEIMTKQREHTPAPPRQLNSNVPKEISDLVMRMLAKSPSDRWRDAEDCRLAWQEAVNHLRAGPVSALAALSAPASASAAVATARTITPPQATTVVPSPVDRQHQIKRRSGEITLPPGGLSATMLPPEIPSAKPAGQSSQMRTPGPSSESVRSSQRRSTQEIRISEVVEPQMKPGSERQPRPSTERRLSQRMGAAESATCPKCDMLNRVEAVVCSRCQHELREDHASSKEQEMHADYLLQQGNFREAASIFARLSERETDKRQRAILRTKEREARSHDQFQQAHDLQSRSHGLVNRGDLKGGIEMLERGLRDVRETGTSATGAEMPILQEINSLRLRLRRRRNLRILLIVAVVLTAMAVAWLVWEQYQAGKLGLTASAWQPGTTSGVVPEKFS